METELVKIKPEDFEAAFLVYKRGLSNYLEELFGWSEQYQRKRVVANYKWDWFHWVVDAGRRVALLCYKLYENSYHIHLLIVLPAEQAQGVGSNVIESLHAQAEQEGRDKITLNCFVTNTGALRFYERHGYKVVKEGMDSCALEFRFNSTNQVE